MAQLEPPPNSVEISSEGTTSSIWRTWFNNLRNFINSHTGGSTPTSPATGTSWNAHGNIAAGDTTDTGTNPLKIEDGAFVITGTSGPTPDDIEVAGTHMAFIPDKAGAFRAGSVQSTQWSAAATGDGSVATGFNCTASGNNSVAMGRSCSASTLGAIALGLAANANTGNAVIALGNTVSANSVGSIAIGANTGAGEASTANGCLAIGDTVQVSGATSMGIGSSITVFGPSSGALASTEAICIGRDIQCLFGDRSIVIGKGISAAQKLTNIADDTLYMGINSTVPTLIMTGGDGTAGSTGFVGIIETSPLSTLDIGGSVGFKYTPITASGGTYTIAADDEEYTFTIDLGSNNHTIVLPQLGATTVDRRVYYIKAIDKTGGAFGTYQATINPNASDQIEDWPGVTTGPGELLTAGNGFAIDPGDSITVIANNDDGAWWVI